jgi:hypothetical protein
MGSRLQKTLRGLAALPLVAMEGDTLVARGISGGRKGIGQNTVGEREEERSDSVLGDSCSVSGCHEFSPLPGSICKMDWPSPHQA